MPTYEYQCSGCSNVQEELRPYEKRDEAVSCEECGKDMARLPSAPCVLIKDQKMLKLPGRQPVLKKRTRMLGSKLGIIRPQELGNAIWDLENKYGKDIQRAEEAENLKNKQAMLEIKSKKQACG